MANGRIFSIETMGLVDGPGIRVVVFMAGCPLRCVFCHNPDSWDASSAEEYTPEALVQKIKRFTPYFCRSGGGVTFSGGEPLLQSEFLLETLALCKKEGIHTCVDTSGVGGRLEEEILENTDLLLLDVKAIDSDGFRAITGGDISTAERFMEKVCAKKTPVVVRQVVIPSINDTDEYMEKLSAYIKIHLPHSRKVELLPYHAMGEHKYEKLGVAYPLKGVEPMDEKRTKELFDKHFRELQL